MSDIGKKPTFPKQPFNRPGLNRIDYHLGGYAYIRDYMLHQLDNKVALRDWTYRGADDPGIALLEGAAIAGDILCFYTDLYAGEAWLRSARWRESIAGLVALLGYRLSPGLGGRAVFALEVGGDRPVTVPKGLPLKAALTGAAEPVVFETREQTVALPALSRFSLYQPTIDPDLGPAVTELRLAKSDADRLALSRNDRLLVAANGSGDLGQARTLVVMKIRELLGEVLVSFKGTLPSFTSSRLFAFKLARTFRHFGHNAPRDMLVLTRKAMGEITPVYDNLPIYFDRSFHALSGNKTIQIPPDSIVDTIYQYTQIVEPGLGPDRIPLDVAVEDLVPGSEVIVDLGGGQLIKRHITKVETRNMTWGQFSGSSLFLMLNQKLESESGLQEGRIDRIKVHEVVGGVIDIRAARRLDTDFRLANVLWYFGDRENAEALEGRAVQMVRGDRIVSTRVTSVSVPDQETDLVFNTRKLQTEAESMVQVPEIRINPKTGLDPQFYALHFDANFGARHKGFSHIDFPLETPEVTVYGNLAEADQGQSLPEQVLGNGDSRQTFQTFRLEESPLTYFNRAGKTPPEIAELKVRVDDQLWQQVAGFFGRGAEEQVYVTGEDRDGTPWVQFGDGISGARLPSGFRNVRAHYRVGTGAHGTLVEGDTVLAQAPVDHLDKVYLNEVASGGSLPENGENARTAAPGKVQSLGRLVSLQDYETEALGIAGVARARARWVMRDCTPRISLGILMETGRAAELGQVAAILADYDRCRGPRRYPLEVVAITPLNVSLQARFALEPGFDAEIVTRQIKIALGVSGEMGNGIDGSGGLFDLMRRRPGDKEYSTRAEAMIQNTAGVAFAKVILPRFSLPCPPNRILVLNSANLILELVASPATEVC